MNYEIKQVIVMRTDLNMRKGKMIAQGAHAAMAFLASGRGLSIEQQKWLHGPMAKICVRVDSEEEFDEIEAKARAAGLEVHVIMDAGHTEFHGVPTRTCLAIGPTLVGLIDGITGHLKLL